MSAPTFFFEITTPERTLFSSEVRQVTLPTAQGEITVLANHIPLVSLLVPGEVRSVTKEGEEVLMAVSGGFIQVQGNNVTILADTAERAEEIDEARADEARRRAEEVMKESVQNSEAMAAATAMLEKELARVRAAQRHKRRRGSDQMAQPHE